MDHGVSPERTPQPPATARPASSPTLRSQPVSPPQKSGGTRWESIRQDHRRKLADKQALHFYDVTRKIKLEQQELDAHREQILGPARPQSAPPTSTPRPVHRVKPQAVRRARASASQAKAEVKLLLARPGQDRTAEAQVRASARASPAREAPPLTKSATSSVPCRGP